MDRTSVKTTGTMLFAMLLSVVASTAFAADGFYSVVRDADGVWWGVKPDGTKFVPNGVVHVNLDASPDPTTWKSAYGQRCREKHGTPAAWTTNALVRLKDWGFNIIGCDSDYDRFFKEGPAEAMGFGYAYGLYTHRPLRSGDRKGDLNFCITPQDGNSCGLYFPNVFHPDYERLTDEYCAKACGSRKNDRALFGYYISNELAWWGRGEDKKSAEGMFDYVNTRLAESHPARQALERIVAACGGDREALATKEKFLEAVAERYFSVNAAAIRRHDPNHLILGCRFAGLNHPMLMRIAGKYCDVVTFNAYSWADLAHHEVRESRFGRPVASLWREMHDLAQKPLMITEWSFLSLDRGHRSSRGAGMRVRTQRERVAAAELYLKTCLSLPFMLGTSYFRHADMPKASAGGGEDCAYGLVDEHDEPYPELTAMFKRVHAEEQTLRRAPGPKAVPGADDGSLDAAAFRAKNRWNAGRLTFSRKDDAFRLENGMGYCFEGRIGRGPLGTVGLGGTNVVRFVAMARLSKHGSDHCEWPDAQEVERADWNEGEQALYLTVCNRKTSGFGLAFRMRVKITMNAGGNGLMGEILSLSNIGERRFEVISTYLRPYPCWNATPEGVRGVSGPVFGSCAEATWDQPGENRVCRCFTCSRNAEKVQFVFYGDGRPHPDAIFVPNGGNIVLEPGKEHVFPESMYLVLEPGLKSAVANPYGVVTDATRSEYGMHEDVIDMVKGGGLGYMRVDWDWRVCQPKAGQPFDFTKYDRLVAAAEARGVTVLPIVYGTPEWAQPAWEHLDEYAAFVSATVKHYGTRLPVIEIWNEQNITGFWRNPDPKLYVPLLRAAYRAAKAANPQVRVAMGGLAGWALPFVEGQYQEGMKDCCDIVNVHPYAYPYPPENAFQTGFGKLHDLMAKYGDAGKPVWFTEVGWPTHDVNMSGSGNFVPAALKVARPEKQTWNVLYASCLPDDETPDQSMARTLEEQLPVGSKVLVATPKETVAQLAAGGWDAVVYPPDESYPADTLEAVLAFVRDGGTLIDLGGMPLWGGYRNGVKHAFDGNWKRFARFHIGLDSFWLPGSELPKNQERLPVYATEAGLAAGVKQEPTGFKCGHFFTAKALKGNDRMVPIVAGRNPLNGKETVAVCVYLLDSELKGRVAVGGIAGIGTAFPVTETMQAQNTVRAMAISFAEGLEAYFTYCLRAYERDRFYSEDHFGIIHANLVPKPAWLAVKNFTLMRPAGSVNYPGAWRQGEICRTAWRRPDGVDAGMVWHPGAKVRRELVFPSDAKMRFHDMWGKPAVVRNLGGGRYSLELGDGPVYYAGARPQEIK